MALLDWLIFGAMYALIVGAVIGTKNHMKSVADFLAAGRGAGRYLLSISAGIAGLGAITVVANLEAGYEAGFAFEWWGISMGLVLTVLAVTGWVNYRFRRTRALTLAEFFERRYSRRFRIFAGLVAFGAGLINFGIFPAVGARFFMHYMAIPDAFEIAGVSVATFPCVMFFLLATAVYFVLAGGQVAVLITDFIQGAYANVTFLVLSVYLLIKVKWSRIVEVMLEVEPGHSKINPFDTGYVEDFNLTYFVIGMIGVVYSAMSWQGTQAYNASAKSAHEAKMGVVIGLWRGKSMAVFMTLVPIIIYTVLHHPEWAGFAGGVTEQLATIDNEAVRNQMRAPVALSELLPVGLFGLFATLMLAAFVSTHNTYLHSWASIFIQDVVLPFRKTPLSARAHLLWLRSAIVGVAVFIFLFSLLYKQSQAILLFFALTGAIFAGWSGAVIIGGLYTRWGNLGGAWAAGISGVTLTLGGFFLEQVKRAYDETGRAFWGLLDGFGTERAEAWAQWAVDDLPNGQVLWGYAMWICSGAYVVGSLLYWLKTRETVDLDRLLHRGDHEVESDREVGDGRNRNWWKWFGVTEEYNRRDRVLLLLTYGWTALWIVVFIIGTVFFVTRSTGGDWSPYNVWWARYWEIYMWILIAVSAVVAVWLIGGGVRDVRRLLHTLSTQERDAEDDGWTPPE